MAKKKLYIIIGAVVLLIIAIAVVLYCILFAGKNLEHYEITLEDIKTTIRIGVPKEKGIAANSQGTIGNKMDFVNDTEGYKVSVGLYHNLKSIYEDNMETSKEQEGFKEIEINKYKGYEFNESSFSKEMRIYLGDSGESYANTYHINVARTKNHNEPLDDLMKNKDIQTIIKSFKVVDYVEKTQENVQEENVEE